MTPPSDRWTVQLIRRDQIRARLARWQDEAIVRGEGLTFTQTLRTVFTELQFRPVEFGDPIYRAEVAGFVVYHRWLEPFQVWYAVHSEARVVWVQELRPRPDLGYSQESPEG